MASLTRFEELFGDESYNFSTTPTLQDVVPGLIPADSKFASKELNERRQAVTGRSFRSPVPRSMNPRQMNLQQQQQQQEQYFEPLRGEGRGPSGPGLEGGGPGGGGAFGPEGASGKYLIEQQGKTGRLGEGTLGNEVGDSLAGSLGKIGTTGAATATLGALGLGAPTGMIPGIAVGSFVSSALNPIVAGNVLGGGLVAGQMGLEAGTNTGDPFAPSSTQSQAAQIAAFNAVDPGIGGAIEMGVESLLSTFFGTKSNTSKAEEAAAIGMNTATAETGRQAAAEAFFADDGGVQGTNTLGTGLVGNSLTASAPMSSIGTSLGSYATGTIGSAAMGELTGEVAAPQGEDFGGRGFSGSQGKISKGLQSMGFGGTSGTMGVGTGGLTDPVSGMQQGVFGEPGFNPHASEMDISNAPTPTVGGSQGHGVGQTGNVGTGTMGGYQGGHSGDPNSGPGGGGGAK